jgi:hypothetical protein
MEHELQAHYLGMEAYPKVRPGTKLVVGYLKKTLV